MVDKRELESYYFHEQEWDSYEQLRSAFEWEVPDRFNVADYVCTRWADDKGRVALFATHDDGREETYTFWQVERASNRLANVLRDEGVGRGDRIGIYLSSRPETLIGHLAAWKAGAVSVPLSTLFERQALGFRLRDADVSLCLADDDGIETLRDTRSSCPDLETVLVVDGDAAEDGERPFWETVGGAPPAFDNVDTAAEDPFVQIYTSGTTGDPKGAVHPHRVLLGHLPGYLTVVSNLRIDDETVVWGVPDWAWQYGLLGVLATTHFYGKPVVAHNGGPFDPEHAYEQIERYGVTNFLVTPSVLRMMQAAVDDPTEQYDLGTVRQLASGGSTLSEDLVDWVQETFGAPIHDLYGQTEINYVIGDCTALFDYELGTLGRPTPGHDVDVVDVETAEPTVEVGDVGEIAVRYEGDPVVLDRYWNNPEQTAKKKRDNGWGLTEDLGRWTESGYLVFEGRKGDTIISSGYTIGPSEVEDSLASHDAVLGAGVVGAPDDERGEVPVAFVELVEGVEPSDELREELSQYVKDTLAKYQYPREVTFVDELPRTTTGKVQRYELEQQYVDAGDA